ncbi:hypothetical protein [Actinoplanes sp. URMC 104]|uniref:hypothetical protein n=1 Tax=Actinoplanes sp. URMC 104 TaxID=3423409 RepID=UPI003F1932C2
MNRADLPVEAGHRPLYARLLRLRTLTPSGFLCFVFLEGAIALGVLLALAELVSWWGVLVLPVTVAIMVKLNDVIAGSLTPPAAGSAPPQRAAPLRPAGVAVGSGLAAGDSRRGLATGDSRPSGRVGEDATVRLPGVVDRGQGAPINRPWAERAETQQQWLRQSATRRYE